MIITATEHAIVFPAGSIETWLANNWIALISLTISCYSVYYTHKIDRRNKPNLIIENSSALNANLVLKPCISYPGAHAQACFFVSIINKSNSPITIYKVTNGENITANKCIPHNKGKYIRYSESNGLTSKREINLSSQLVLPLRLDSYDAIETIVFFPNFRRYCKSEIIELCFFTSRGIFKKSFSIMQSDFSKQDILMVGR